MKYSSKVLFALVASFDLAHSAPVRHYMPAVTGEVLPTVQLEARILLAKFLTKAAKAIPPVTKSVNSPTVSPQAHADVIPSTNDDLYHFNPAELGEMDKFLKLDAEVSPDLEAEKVTVALKKADVAEDDPLGFDFNDAKETAEMADWTKADAVKIAEAKRLEAVSSLKPASRPGLSNKKLRGMEQPKRKTSRSYVKKRKGFVRRRRRERK